MSHKATNKRLALRLWAVALACMAFPWALHAQTATKDSVLWYRKPAPVWTQALPVGNGRMGAVVFGGANEGTNNGNEQNARRNAPIADGSKTRAQDEHLQLNEDTIWQGSRADRLNPKATEGTKQVRALLLESKGTDAAKIAEAERIAERTMIAVPPGMPSYSTLGDLYLRSSDNSPVTDYRRELNLNTGIARVTYTAGGLRYTREVFASAEDKVIVVHVAADKPGKVSFLVSMDRPDDFTVTTQGQHDLVLTEGPNHKEAIRFRGQVRVLAKRGTVSAKDKAIAVDNADEVTLLIAAATDFKGGPITGGDPARLCAQALDAAAKKDYATLRNRSVADQRRWMERVSFQLGTPDPALEALPTDERIKRVAKGSDDLGLQALYFQFARYLLVGSSRPGGLPANLQGLWASGTNNVWGSKWTININAEMNYWMAEAANLSDTHLPLIDLTDMLRNPQSGTGRKVAEKYYGARGFVAHHNTDIWGDAEPIDLVGSGVWPMGAAWMTLHAWDHFAYSGDKTFLQQRAWPLLHDASLFFLDYLVDDGNGHLVTGPSLSPENSYKLADGSRHALAMAPTMDIEILRELFQRTIQASEVLGIDSEFRGQVRTAMSKLPPFKVGSLGQLQEWQEDYAEAEPGHRHISHLWALFPGTQINPEQTPDLARAAQTTLERRLARGGGQTGWSRAWVVNYWDRLGQGDKAYESLQVMFGQSTFPNMMDTHPPGLFQIDGNLGAANGMIEALVQSFWYPDHIRVNLLPALPSAWPNGSVKGIRVRGGAELAMQWSGGKLKTITWHALQGGDFELRLPSGQHLASISGLSSKPAENAGLVKIHTDKGKTYSISLN